MVAISVSACSFSFNSSSNSAPANASSTPLKPASTPSSATPTPEAKASPVVIAPKTYPDDGDSRRIRFKAGSSSATVSDAVIRGEQMTYLIDAKSGQTMTVNISSLEDNAVFQILAPSGKYLADAGEMDDATSWDGELPANGDYKIIVGGTRGNATFKLTVSIE